MDSKSAISLLQSVCTDYVNSLVKEGHETAGRSLAANCTQAIAALKQEGSSRRPPQEPQNASSAD